MSDWGGDWGDPAGQDDPYQQGWDDPGGKPVKNPMGQHLRAEEIQLERRNPIMDPAQGVITNAWEGVQNHPFETLLLSFIAFLFQNCGNFCNAPMELISAMGDGVEGGSQTEYDYGGSILAVAGDFLGNIGAVELGAVAAVMVFVVIVMIVAIVLWALIYGAQYIIWLRIHRRQDVSLARVSDLFPFLIKLILTYLLYGAVVSIPILFFGIMAALVLPIMIGADGGPALAGVVVLGVFVMGFIPTFYLMARLFFTSYLVVDKNIAYIEALKGSWQMSEGMVVDIIVLYILLFFLNVLGFLLCLVGMIVTNAIAEGAKVSLYDRVAEPGNAYISGHDTADVFS